MATYHLPKVEKPKAPPHYHSPKMSRVAFKMPKMPKASRGGVNPLKIKLH